MTAPGRYRAFSSALLAAAALVMAADVTVRLLEARLSGDVAQIRAMPLLLRGLEQPADARAVIMGNSLIGNGFNQDEFIARLAAAPASQPATISLLADASNIWDWLCLASEPSHGALLSTDLLILGYGWDQLTDQVRLRSGSLSRSCSLAGLRQLDALRGAFGLEDWLKIYWIRTSRLYANRDNLRHQLLQRLIPAYQEESQRLNRRADARVLPGPPSSAPATFSYQALRMLLDRLEQAGVAVLLVAMPVQQPYALDQPGLCAALADTPHRLADLRGVIPVDPSLWRDDIHLNAAGAAYFSAALAEIYRSLPSVPLECSA